MLHPVVWWTALSLLLAPGDPPRADDSPADGDSLYGFSIERGWLRMKDGVRLAVTYWRPKARGNESFPVLLEYLPYRKDDSFYRRDYPLYAYFVRRGFLMAKVDVRGTGGSEGALPEREYSRVELDDGVEIIRQLARIPGSSGAVGMWGISWGGFNALQVAMRRPLELRAILALHASDDLYHDDVRYIDGGLHIDPYTLQIDHENGLPRTPDYALDSAYFRNRFNAYPWVLTYLKQPVDGDFWRQSAPISNYDAIKVPCYLIGGLLDGYRDTPLRLLERLQGPVKVEIGPWNHAWPDNGTPGPNYEWRQRAVRWWNHWLRGEDTGLLDEPPFIVFVRDGHGPDANLAMTPGHWRQGSWPLPGATTAGWLLAPGHRLSADSSAAGVDSLRYLSGFGTVGGDWWGEPTGDMRADDAGSLVYDGEPLREPMVLIGTARVSLRVSASGPLANWTARLEDVAPDGPVSLVTGAAINGTQRESTLAPKRLEPGRVYDLEIPLHFTTWTFQPGHRIRLAVSNAQFPMIWPTPYPMTTSLWLGTGATRLELPVVTGDPGPPPDLPAPEPREHRPDARTLAGAPPTVSRVILDQLGRTTGVEYSAGDRFTIGTRRIDNQEREYYQTNEVDPADSRFLGEESHRIQLPSGRVTLKTTIDIRSDSAAFHVTVTRRIYRDDRLVRERRWKESIPREFH
ncbi:MAG TPA: CocE/NonD family hydrolase [Gemmatimonadales bacterium]|nr:CocE/NonD family hydrolase [Gemmatimonadales bacterium]